MYLEYKVIDNKYTNIKIKNNLIIADIYKSNFKTRIQTFSKINAQSN